MSMLTGSQMKYLHVIYKAQKGNSGIRSVEVSRELGVTKASVSRMVRLLMELGLVSIKRYGVVTLTLQGENEGAAIHDKMTRILPFFSEYLKLEEPEALNSAYSFLYGFSDDCVEKLMGKGWTESRAV